jgi:hypothetical protein
MGRTARRFSGTRDSAKGLAIISKGERMGTLCGRRGRMILLTTPSLEGKKAVKYLGSVSGDAIVGIDIDYETIGASSSMLMVSATGTAVVVEPQ